MRLLAHSNPRPRGSAARSGMTLLEIMVTLALITTGLLAAAGSFSTSLTSAQSAQRQSEAAVFLSMVMENLGAQEYGGLLVFNGDRLFDGADLAHSRYVADLEVFQASLGLIQINVLVSDLDSGEPLTRLVTLRADR
jgi:prepilin-type N-terminal cleavage/methylation domain-containing protein